MAKWSGNGIPNTRRKLHRFREAQRKLRLSELREQAFVIRTATRGGQRFDQLMKGCSE